MDHEDDEELRRNSYPLIRVTKDKRDDSHDRLLQLGPSIHQDAYDAPSRFKSLHRPRSSVSSYSSLHADEADVSAARGSYLYPDDRPANTFPPPHETAYNGRAGYLPVAGASKLWGPIWLNKLILICFVLLFAGLLTGLLLVWYSSTEQDGFHVSDSTSHYTWTYGPTAVLIIVVGLWRQVDYHCKSLTPWAELRKGPVSASRSLLLDYVSPLQLVTLTKALWHGHLAVIATITVFILLKIVTIFSTGLFVLGTIVKFDSSYSINTTTKFDPSLAAQFNSTSPLNADVISTAPVYAYYGNFKHGLPFNPGLSNDYAYATFAAAESMPANASLTAEVDAFVPSANCRIIDVKIDGPKTINGLNKTHAFGNSLSLILPDGDICKHWSHIVVPVQDPQYYPSPRKQVTGTSQNVYCSVNNASKINLSKGPDAVLYTLTSVSYKQRLFANFSTIDSGSTIISYVNSTSRTVENMVNLICQPSYTITRLNVTNSSAAFSEGNLDEARIAQVPAAKNRTIPGFSAQNLSSVFETTVKASTYLFGEPTSSQINNDSQVSSTMWSMLAQTQNSDNYSLLFDGARLQSAVESTFKGISLQFAQQSLLGPDQSSITGEATYPQRRLRVRSTSLWVMTTCFSLMIIFTVLVILMAPSAAVSRNPNSIATLSTILARSPDLNRELRTKGATDYRVQSAILSPHQYRASVLGSEAGPPAFKIQIQPGERPYNEPTDIFSPKLQFWSPPTLSYPVIILTITLPVGAIVALELLQRHSNHHDGLLNLQRDRFSEAYIHYIPALVMLLIATMFNSLDFNVAAFTPFLPLKNGKASSRRSLMSHILGKSPPFAIFEGLRSWHLGALLSTFGALVASALTVVVSGLYSVQMISSVGPTRSLFRSDSFNLTWNNSVAADNGAAAILSLIEHMNLSYPNFTYGEYAFPTFSLGDLQTQPEKISIISGPVSAVIPAIRANLDCTILPESSYTVSTTVTGPDAPYGVDVAQVDAQFKLPAKCQLGGTTGDQSFFNYTNTFFLTSNNEGIFAGAQLDLSFARETRGLNYGESYTEPIPDNPSGCPSLAFTFGYFKLNSTDKTNVTTMVCYQQLQQVSTNVTLLVNSTKIDTTTPPVPDESTVRLLANPRSSSGDTTFEFRLQNNLINEIATFNGSAYTGNTENSRLDVVNAIDIFYQAVINGSDKTRPEDLVSFKNEPRFLNATNYFYRKYLAQAVNANMRERCDSGGCPTDSLITARQSFPSPDLLATVTISTPRLVQSATSKLILQILLGVMIICGILAYIMTPMRNLLPCNPCTIAGGMSLLAGSKLCWSTDEAVCECCGKLRARGDGQEATEDMIHAAGEVDEHDDRAELIPPGAEWMSDKNLHKVFARMRFSMGWWRSGYGDGDRGGKRFGIDVGPRADGLDDQDWSLGKRAGSGMRHPPPDLDFDSGPEQRRSLTPGWILEPSNGPGGVGQQQQQPQPQPQTISGELSSNKIRQSRLPSWMLGPLKPDPIEEEEEEQDLGDRPGLGPGHPPPQSHPPVLLRRLGPEERGPSWPAAALGDEEDEERPLRSSGRSSRLPDWLLGPLRPDGDERGVYGRPGEEGDGEGEGR